MEVEFDDPLSISIGKGMEQYALKHTENRDAGRYPKRQGKNRRNGKSRVLPQLSQTKANVLEGDRHDASARK
jgi:hypothetical protein